MARKEDVLLGKDVEQAAEERIEEAFDLFDTVSVGFSGGKDSTLCLELAMRVAERRGRLPLDVIFFDEEAIPPETIDYMRRRDADPRINLRWLCLPVQHFNACSRREPHWWPWDPDKEHLWCREMPEEGITAEQVPDFPVQPPRVRPTVPESNGIAFPPDVYGQVGLIMGIRVDESMNRRKSMKSIDYNGGYITKHGPYAQNVRNVYPIYDVKNNAVWGMIARNGWDYNEAYDVMEMAGISVANQRIAPPFGTEPIKGLDKFRACWPDLWAKMVHRVRGADAAARYSRTDLYWYMTSGGDDPDTLKPADMRWEEWIHKLLSEWHPDQRKNTTKSVELEMKRHFRWTQEPIAAVVPHPATGVSWRSLAMLAARGDPKNRKDLRAYAVPSDAPQEQWDARYERYWNDIAEMERRGELAQRSSRRQQEASHGH